MVREGTNGMAVMTRQVYVGHFKCNLGTIQHDFPSILRWARQVYQIPGVGFMPSRFRFCFWLDFLVGYLLKLNCFFFPCF